MREVHLRFHLVLPDDADVSTALEHMAGREFPGVPGSWVVAAAADASPASTDQGAGRPWDPARPAPGPATAGCGQELAIELLGEPTDDEQDDWEDPDPGDLDPGDVDPGD